MRSAVVRLLLIVILTANALCLFVQSQSPPQQQQQSQSLSAAAPSQRQVPRRRLGSRLIGGQTRRPAANGAGASAVGEQQRRRTERPGSRIGVRSGTGYRPMRQVPGSGANLLADERQSRQIRWPSRPMAVPAGTTSFELPDADAAFGLSELRCVQKPERLSFCSGIGYNKLRLPNRFQQDKVEEIVTALEEWRSLVVSRACHENLAVLLCTLYAPVCIEKHMNVELLPCRETCAEVRSSCQPALASRGFSWPDRVVNCNNMSAEGTTAHCLSRVMARQALQHLQAPAARPEAQAQADESVRTTRATQSNRLASNKVVCIYCLGPEGRLFNQLKPRFCRAFRERRGPLAVALIQKQWVSGTESETRATVTRVLFQNMSLSNGVGVHPRAQQTLLQGSELAIAQPFGTDKDCACGGGPSGRELTNAGGISGQNPSAGSGAGQNPLGPGRENLVLVAVFNATSSTWKPIAMSAATVGIRLNAAVEFGRRLSTQGPSAFCAPLSQQRRLPNRRQRVNV